MGLFLPKEARGFYLSVIAIKYDEIVTVIHKILPNPKQRGKNSRNKPLRQIRSETSVRADQNPEPGVAGGARATTQQAADSQTAQAANFLRLLSSLRGSNPAPAAVRRRAPVRTAYVRRVNARNTSNEGVFPPLPINTPLPSIQLPAVQPSTSLPQATSGHASMGVPQPHPGSALPQDADNNSVLNQFITAAASAISLTTDEYQQRMDQAAANGEPAQTVSTAASFMDRFLEHLQRGTATERPFPRLSLVSESISNEDPTSTSIFRVFRMQPREGAQEPAASDTAPQPTQRELTPPVSTASLPLEADEAAARPNPANSPTEMVPVVIIGIRSIPTRPPGGETEPTASLTPDPQPNTRIRTRAATNRGAATRTAVPSTAHANEPWQRAQRRSWVIYVIGSTYPANHPILSTAFGDNPTYEDLLMLSTFLGPARPPTTTQEAIDAQFKEVVFDEFLPGVSGIALLNGNRCQVCLSDYEHKDKLRILTCQHAYHTACIDKWLTQGSNNCPVCRRAGTTSEAKAQPSESSDGEGNDGASVSAALRSGTLTPAGLEIVALWFRSEDVWLIIRLWTEPDFWDGVERTHPNLCWIPRISTLEGC
ncbi:hypothetical protein L0F63_002476 [Massospora cicadina]|nr:hypothetical protein L0F63_002476 [Massospora cicadina]